MRHITTKHKTKRGNVYNTRATKLANGMSQVLADRQVQMSRMSWLINDRKLLAVKQKDDILLKLAVRGTCDRLASCNFDVKTKIKHHPEDRSYTKKVLVLSDIGRRKLERLRQRRSITPV